MQWKRRMSLSNVLSDRWFWGRKISAFRGLRTVAHGGLITLVAASCGGPRDSAVVVAQDTVAAAMAPAAVLSPPVMIDTGATTELDVWPVIVAPNGQVAETRRIVELLQADLSRQSGFETAVLLAGGDGSGLVLLVQWNDAAEAVRGRALVASWLRGASPDTVSAAAATRSQVIVRRTVGTAPLLTESAMVQFTRYLLKPGQAFATLATLADSSLAIRVLHDTAAQGGATLAAAESGTVYMLMQARTATALDPAMQPAGPPFWAPLAARDEQLMAVVAIVRRR